MASTAFGKAAESAPKNAPAKVVRYELVEGEHAFMKVVGKNADGTPIKEATGEVKGVAKLRGVHSDSTLDKLAAWVWLDTPDSIDALIDSMPQIYVDALRIRAIGEEAYGWPPRPSKAKPAAPAAAAPAAPAPKTAFGKAKAVEAEAKAISNGQDPYADLPF